MPIQSTATNIPTVPALLAMSHGIICAGHQLCFYCGAPSPESHPTSVYVKGSFTGLTGVFSPGSPWICEGCVLCFRDTCEINQIDGVRRFVTRGAMRAFSWVITTNRALSASKAHIAQLRAVCLAPPDPPFAIVLSDSGQTHQLYRGVVNHDSPSANGSHPNTPIVVTLEAQRITYRATELVARLNLCGRLISATGKPALAEPITARFATAVMDRFRDGELLVREWETRREEPLSRLALWLSGSRDQCQLEYPSDVT